MGNLLKQPFTRYVREQIEVRQEVHGKSQNRTPKEISYLNSRNAWVKLSSAIWLEDNRINFLKTKNGQTNPLMNGVGGDEDLAKKYILFNGLSSYNEDYARAGIASTTDPNGAYGVGGTNFGYSPMPGIINANIKDLERGSLKEATLNIKVQNKNQFDVIETLYMRIGYYILLEWGVDKYLTKEGGELKLVNQISTIGEEKWWGYKAKITKETPSVLEAKNSEINKVLRDIEKYRKRNKGNYDALFGIITNFSWTFNKDGSYDIALRINSVGDVIESLKVNTPAFVKDPQSQPTPQNVGDFETIKKRYQDDPVPQQVFYDVLYPGLKETLQKFYQEMKSKGFHNVFGGIKNVGGFGRTKYRTGNGYEYIFEKKTSVGFGNFEFSFLPYYKDKTLNFEFISPEGLAPELANNKSIVDEILPNPSIGTVEINNDLSFDQQASLIKNWVSNFFRDTMDRLEEFYPDVMVIKRITAPPSPGQNFVPGDSLGDGGLLQRTFFSPEKGDPRYIVTLSFTNINEIEFEEQNIELQEESISSRALNYFTGDANTVKRIDTGAPQIKGWDGYSDVKQNRLARLDNGYGAKAAGALWPGVKNGWFFIHLGIDELLRGINAGVEYAPPLEQGPISLYQVSRNNNKEINPRENDFPEELGNGIFPDNKTISELLFMLCDEEKFLTYVYDLFVEAEKAGGEDDPRFEIPEEEDIADEQVEVNIYETELQEKQNKNAIYNWFYNIRKLYPLYTYQSVNEAYTDGKKDIRNILDNSLDTLPKIALFNNKGENFFKEIGRIINPFDHQFKPTTKSTSAAIENLNDKVEDDIEDVFDQKSNLTDTTDPRSTVAILRKASKDSGKPLSPPQEGLAGIVELGYKEPSKKIEEWNRDVGFPQYTLSKARDFAFLFVTPIKNSYFVRLGVLLEFLEKKVVFTLDNKSPIINFDTNPETNICYTIDNVISTNITKCLISNPNFYTETFGVTPKYTSIFQNLDPFVEKIDGYYYGKIMNIYFSFDRIEQILQGVNTKNEIDLFTFLQAITDDINECTGNITNVEPVIDQNTNTIKFIDQTSIPGLEQIARKIGYGNFDEKNVTLEVFGYNQRSNNPETYKSSFVRNINLKTEISKDYTSMITIGATANGSLPGSEATALSKWNIGIHDRFKPLSPKSFEKDYQSILRSYATLIKNNYARCGLNFPEQDTDYTINYDYISSAQDIMSNYYKYAQAESMNNYLEDKNAIVESSIGFIPFNLGLEMDGISGIKIYNRVTVNTSFLPSNYGDSLDFVVSQVNHKIENNQWITNLETIATSKYKDGS